MKFEGLDSRLPESAKMRGASRDKIEVYALLQAKIVPHLGLKLG